MPSGTIAGQAFSRLFIGGNLIGGYAHSRDLTYVSTLMRRYNTPAKIRETLELAERTGSMRSTPGSCRTTPQLFEHWKNGGKIKWFAQVRLDGGRRFLANPARDRPGGHGVAPDRRHLRRLARPGKFEKLARSLQFIKARKRMAGVAAHDLRVIVECEKPSWTSISTRRPSTATSTTPRPGRRRQARWARTTIPGATIRGGDRGHGQSQEALDRFQDSGRRGASSRARPSRYAFNSGADFILVGMFDWQIEEDAKLARRVVGIVAGREFQTHTALVRLSFRRPVDSFQPGSLTRSRLCGCGESLLQRRLLRRIVW